MSPISSCSIARSVCRERLSTAKKSYRGRVAARRSAVGSEHRRASLNASRRSRHLLHRPQCSPPSRVHARQRQLQRHAELDSKPDHVGFVSSRANGVSMRMSCASPRPSARAIASKNSGVASGNGLPASGPRAMRPMPLLRTVDRRLREEHDVASGQIDVLVRRVEGGRLAAQCPVRGRIQVAHSERRAARAARSDAERRGRKQPVERRELLGFPRETRADVDRMNARRTRLGRRKHRAVEARGEKDG